MPILVLGIGSFAIAALSLTKDLFKEADDSGNEIQGIIMNTTLLLVAGAGIYLMSTNKLKFTIK